VSWYYTGNAQPGTRDPVLCAWRVDATHPGAVRGYLYGVGAWNGSRWHDPEDERADVCEPMYWREIESPASR
jgi:hypothetical protein